MLQITIPDSEFYDERSNQFITIQGRTLQLEHSLISVSKWESKWEKPFLVKDPPKTNEELIDYVRCMTLTQNVDHMIYYGLSRDNLDTINSYIEAPMSATWFSNDGKSPMNRDIITSEIIYYWMVAFNIPFECQKWHLNRLLTLIRVCNIKNSPQKKMSKKEVMDRNRRLNAARRAKKNSKG